MLYINKHTSLNFKKNRKMKIPYMQKTMLISVSLQPSVKT